MKPYLLTSLALWGILTVAELYELYAISHDKTSFEESAFHATVSGIVTVMCCWTILLLMEIL